MWWDRPEEVKIRKSRYKIFRRKEANAAELEVMEQPTGDSSPEADISEPEQAEKAEPDIDNLSAVVICGGGGELEQSGTMPPSDKDRRSMVSVSLLLLAPGRPEPGSG